MATVSIKRYSTVLPQELSEVAAIETSDNFVIVRYEDGSYVLLKDQDIESVQFTPDEQDIEALGKAIANSAEHPRNPGNKSSGPF